MVNLRHPDNIFYDCEGDLFVITTDLEGRQEVQSIYLYMRKQV